LAISAKLRNALLFRQSLVWILGRWPSWESISIEDRTLQKIAINAHNAISDKVASIQREVIVLILEDNRSDASDTILTAARGAIWPPDYTLPMEGELDSLMNMPSYVRNLRRIHFKVSLQTSKTYSEQISCVSSLLTPLRSHKILHA